MNQGFHILRKDIRHFFPEILLNLALFVAFAAVVPRLWPGGDGSTIEPVLGSLLRVLLPLGWLVMIVRVLHDEPLVGDRQFWITRPYRRSILLAEKLGFLLFFLNLPLFLTQMYLLHRAGLPVLPALGALLYLEVSVFFLFELPLLALAAVTANFGQNLLWLLGAVVYGLFVVTLTVWATHKQMTSPGMDWVLLTVLGAVLGAVVIWMYARRAVVGPRALLVGLPPLMALFYLAAPTRWLVHRVYAAAPGTGALIFDPAHEQQQAGSGKPLLSDGDVVLQLPVRFQGANGNDESRVQGATFTLRAANGETWTSGLESTSTWLRDGATQLTPLAIPPRVYQRMQGQPVIVSMQAEVTRYSFRPARTVTVPAEGSFDVPSGGRCAADEEQSFLRCAYALYSVPAVRATFQVQRETCNVPGQKLVLKRRTDGATPASLNLSLDPVWRRDIPFARTVPSENGTQGQEEQMYLCPGAQASFQEEQLTAHQQLTVTTPPIELSAYVLHEQHSFGAAR